MTFTKTVEIGRVAYIAKGKNVGELATIVDVIDQNKTLIDGPSIPRQVANFRDLHLTKLKTKISHTASHKAVVAAWDKGDIATAWKNSNWAKKLERQKKRAAMTDFDRFKLMRALQARNKLVKLEFGKLKRLQSKKNGGEKKPTAKGKGPAK
ncbi:60S ribosomal protein L14-like [Paramacrobiotus metropolitanus]|uniref:60S ribosomal protein L14-like n=1 Tax=Paramacrobiotus metropolitanus TaxID=2943436 RepID=UPI00244638D2|nr:60S ribosomal protein L14-like [Paramacrobiotus metropolitanus]